MGVAELDHRRHELMADALWDQLKKDTIDVCELCKGDGMIRESTEWVNDIHPIGKSKVCKCRAKALLKLELHYAGLPRELWEADAIKPSMNEHHFTAVHKYCEPDNLEKAFEHGLGFLMSGDNGSGKSSCAAIAVIAALRQKKTAAFISWPDMIEGWRRSIRDPEHAEYLDSRSLKDLVVLDDVGKEVPGKDDTSIVLQKLDSILRMRRGSMLPTIITTNIEADKFGERYGASVQSLLAKRFKVLLYEAGDYRATMGEDWDELMRS